MNPKAPRSRTARGLRVAVLVSALAHGAVLCVTPWFVMRLPAEVAERELRRVEDVNEEPVFFLDLRTTALLVPEVPAELVSDPGEPDVPEEAPSEAIAEPEPEPLPESILESATLADSAAPAQELAPVAEPTPEPVAVAPIVVDPAETAPIATAPVAAAPGVGRRTGSSLASAWVARAATFVVGALGGPRPGATPASGTPRKGDADSGDGSAVFAPRLLDAPKPEYPAACRRRGIEGSVLCRMHVRSDGSVDGVDVVESSKDERLDRAAVRALERWRFDPPRRAGVAIASKVLHRVSFRLR